MEGGHTEDGRGLAPSCWVKEALSALRGAVAEVVFSLWDCCSSVARHSEVTVAASLFSFTRGPCRTVLPLDY